MIGSPRTISAVAAALTLAACSGGGGTSTATPRVVPSSAGKATANITIRFTQGLHRLTTHAGLRRPRFVDPAGNTLDVASLRVSDSTISTSATFTLLPGSDGTQTITAPIVSSPNANDATSIAVVENSTSGPVAVGEGYLSSVQPGTLVTPGPLTLYMIPAGIGITTDPANGSDAIALTSDPTALPSQPAWLICSATSWPIAFDATGAWTTQFQTAVGYGGIPIPQILTQVSDNGGTSLLTSTQTNGIVLHLDGSGDGVTAHLQTYDINPLDYNYGAPTSDGYVHFVDNC